MSRNPTTTVSNTSSYPTEPRVANILSTDHTVITLKEIQHESHSDSDYQTLISAINNNFHASQRSTIPSIIKKYWEVHNPLSIETDIILMDTRILIPLTMRKNILQYLILLIKQEYSQALSYLWYTELKTQSWIQF